MRVAYLDCFAGMSGDMFLGALLHAGVPVEVLQEATEALGLGAHLKVRTVDRSGISSVKVDVLVGDQLAERDLNEEAHLTEKDNLSPKAAIHHTHRNEYSHRQEERPETEPLADKQHGPGRSLSAIRTLLHQTPLLDAVKAMAIRTFEILGKAEATVHNVDVEDIHFHEVGAVDAIVDIVAASAGIHHLQVGAWYCSPLNVGGGTVVCSHGTFPVPAPATAELLRGYPTYSAHIEKELITPTGAALLRTLDPSFGRQPAMRVETIGYGGGTRNPVGFPNVVRISTGQAEDEESGNSAAQTDWVTVLETALDDLSPQLLSWAAESALAAGALDAMLTPVTMKKGRPGTVLTVLCEPKDSSRMENLIFRETSTLGIRVRQEQRKILERRITAVNTAYGLIRVKIGTIGETEMNAAAEFEDCRAAAILHGVALKEVQQAVTAAYRKEAKIRLSMLE